MEARPNRLRERTVYQGNVFSIADMDIEIADGIVINRQVLRHPPVVVMLVHDVSTDRYLIEREYRCGSDSFAWGLPAGFMDEGEEPVTAALRELNEETGVHDVRSHVRLIGSYYSSEGMSDELAHIYGIDLEDWTMTATRFDKDEHVESCWLDWEHVMKLPILSSNSVIALQDERYRRRERELNAITLTSMPPGPPSAIPVAQYRTVTHHNAA